VSTIHSLKRKIVVPHVVTTMAIQT